MTEFSINLRLFINVLILISYSHGYFLFPDQLEALPKDKQFLLDERFGRSWHIQRLSNSKSKLAKRATVYSPKEKLLRSGWNYVDTWKMGHRPHEKTISLKVIDKDLGHTKDVAPWLHDNYLHPGVSNQESNASTFSPNSNRIHFGNKDGYKNYEWKRLPYRLAPSDSYFQDGTRVASSTSTSTGTNGSVSPGHSYYRPYERRRLRRYRLGIHPGLIAAPIAGLAAYKAVSALSPKPLVLELGWIGGRKYRRYAAKYPYHPNQKPISNRPASSDDTYFPILRPTGPNPQSWNDFSAIMPKNFAGHRQSNQSLRNSRVGSEPML